MDALIVSVRQAVNNFVFYSGLKVCGQSQSRRHLKWLPRAGSQLPLTRSGGEPSCGSALYSSAAAGEPGRMKPVCWNSLLFPPFTRNTRASVFESLQDHLFAVLGSGLKTLRCSSAPRPRQQDAAREKLCCSCQRPAEIQASSDWLSFQLNCCSVIRIKYANDSQSSYGWTCLSTLRTTGRAGPRS